MTDKVLFIFEMIGVIACAASGTASGINKHMDAFGVTFLAVITAMGGGIIRDLILGAIPPVAFIKPVYVAAATAVSLTMFFIHRYFKKQSLGKLHNFVFVYMDAVGLGAFTVVGIKKAVIMYGFSHLFLVLTTGFITGIGGGILRDVLAGDTPAVFIKYFYACASIIGAVLCMALWNVLGEKAAMLIGITAIVVLRLCAARFHWSFLRITAVQNNCTAEFVKTDFSVTLDVCAKKSLIEKQFNCFFRIPCEVPQAKGFRYI